MATASPRLTRAPAKAPLRIYIGLNNAADAGARAKLALAEALRVGAFERRTLVIATPTGTGWMDPAAMDTFEYLHHGDTMRLVCRTDGGDVVDVEYVIRWDGREITLEPASQAASRRIAASSKPIEVRS